MRINEILDNPLPIDSVQQSSTNANVLRYNFHIDDIPGHIVIGIADNGMMMVQFTTEDMFGQQVVRKTRRVGDQSLRVFSTVLKALKHALSKIPRKPYHIAFNSDPTEPSRISLYRRFVTNASSYLPGWEYDGEEPTTDAHGRPAVLFKLKRKAAPTPPPQPRLGPQFRR